MRLFIAEKPQLGSVIAESLGIQNRKNGYVECKGGDVVTWCIGHLLELAAPETYNPSYAKWNMNDLPLQLKPYKLTVKNDTKSQFETVKQLISKASVIVHAGDPDDEGQLLVDEVIEYCGFKGQVKRVLINDLNPVSAGKSIKNLRDNSEFIGQHNKALARSIGDNIYGINMSRAYTIAAQQKGFAGVLPVGRVMTPIMGLIVKRYLDFKNHVSSNYYTVKASLMNGNDSFFAKLTILKDAPVDDEGRIIDLDYANSIKLATEQKNALIKDVKLSDKEKNAPLPFNLLQLQVKMNRAHGFSSDKTDKIAQDLREKHAAITYNRTDCCYLTTEQFNDAPETITAISSAISEFSNLISLVSPSRKGKAFNDEKAPVHTGIIPAMTKVDASKMTKDELLVYKEIALRYLLQFMPPQKLKSVSVSVDCEGFNFSTSASKVVDQGWASVYKDETESDDDQDNEASSFNVLSGLSVGSSVLNKQTSVTEQKTKPLPLYTEDTLLEDLARVAKYITDPHIKKLLIDRDKEKTNEHGGIGTPATRSAMLVKLRQRNFYSEDGKKKLIPTELGISFYNTLPQIATSPNMTALWHEQQTMIEQGEITVDHFIEALESFVDEQIKSINITSMEVETFKCECGGSLRRRKGAENFFWGCSNYPECKKTLPDKNGKPDYKQDEFKADCPKCGGAIRLTPKAYSCKGCDFKVWMVICNKKISETQCKSLLSKGKTSVIKGFKNKEGKSFDASLILNKETWSTSFQFEKK